MSTLGKHISSKTSEVPDHTHSQNMGTQLTKKKVLFDDTKIGSPDSEPVLKGGVGLTREFRLFSNNKYFCSITSVVPSSMIYFCDWYPELFGIDETTVFLKSNEGLKRLGSTDIMQRHYQFYRENPTDSFRRTVILPRIDFLQDEIPSSEDEEGLFDIDWEDLDEKADALTPSQLDFMRKGSKEDLTDEELREAWKRSQIPRYGRRARQKPILQVDNRKFECICDIDKKYSRHHIRHFDGGMEGEELRTPHFKAFWENYKEKTEMADIHQNSNLFEKTVEESVDDTKGFFRFSPIFPSSTQIKIRKFREQIRKTFRPLDCREVRRYRMSYAEALYLELQEDLYLDSAAFLKHLIIKDHFLHEGANRSVYLRNSRPILNKLVAFLKLAEKLSRMEEYHKEAIILLKSGKYFNDHDENWWWLAEELYTKAVKVSQKSVIDGGKSEAIANYILGTFLLNCVGRVQPAQEHLLKARELSLGKDWNAGRILNKVQDPLYQECANHLCRALIAVSRNLRESGKPEQALPLIHRSHKLCKESKTPKLDIEMETYYELGMTYHEVGMLDWAKVAFRKFVEIAKLENYTRSICEGLLELAICFQSEGDMSRCHHYLLSYLNTAEANKDENLIAFAHRYLGEFYLNNGNPKDAEEHFQKAFLSYLQQCEEVHNIPIEQRRPEHLTLPLDVELTRTLTGLTIGELMMKSVLHLIMKSKDIRNHREMLLLIKWKNNSTDKIPEIYKEILDLSTAKGDDNSFVFEQSAMTFELDGISDVEIFNENKAERKIALGELY